MVIRLLWLAGGLIFLGISIWIWARKLNCKTEVNGKFIRWDSMTPKKDGQQFSPVFEFELGDQWYSCRSFECFSLKQIGNGYKAGQIYKIYVNAKKPKDIIIARKFYWEDYAIVVLAAFCIFMAVVPV